MNPKITDWTGKRVWLIGASSGIGAALAHALSNRGARLALSARNSAALNALGIDNAGLYPCDATDHASLRTAHAAVRDTLGGIDLAIYLAGDYTPMRADAFDIDAAEHALKVNFIGAMRLSAIVLPDLLQTGGGLAYVASVAGYAGLPKALAYGPGKAALIQFAQCLYFDLAPRGIGVWIINPGFVATRLTAKNDFAMPALMTPEQAALATLKGFEKGHFEIHYPRRITWVMKLLTALPYALYFPLVRRLTGA